MALEYIHQATGLEKIFGIDIRVEDVIAARKLGISAEVMDIVDQPFFGRKFNTVYCSHVIEHISHLGQAAEHLRQLTNEFLIVIVPKETVQELNDNPGHVNLFPDVKEVLRFFPRMEVVEWKEEFGDIRVILKP